jgi:hypothetical protein
MESRPPAVSHDAMLRDASFVEAISFRVHVAWTSRESWGTVSGNTMHSLKHEKAQPRQTAIDLTV